MAATERYLSCPESGKGVHMSMSVIEFKHPTLARAVRHSETLSAPDRYRLPGTGVEAASEAHRAFRLPEHPSRPAPGATCPPNGGYRPARDPDSITRLHASTHKMRDPHENTPIRETRPETRLRACMHETRNHASTPKHPDAVDCASEPLQIDFARLRITHSEHSAYVPQPQPSARASSACA